MPQTFDLILKGGVVVNQDGRVERDVGVRGGRIAAIGDLSRASAGREIECRGLHILPGVIDTQVHFREPGLDHKEDLESGSRSAAMGGVTAVFEMPNTDPQTTTPEALADKVRRGYHRMQCDFAYWVGGTHENADDLAELERLPGAAGIKVFMGSSTGSLLVEDDEGIARILRRTRRRAAFHSEDEAMLRARKDLRVEGDPRSHPVWRSAEVALACTQRLVRIARDTGARIHVLHITTAEEMALLREHKDLVTVEVTPHHLTLAGPEDYERLGTYIQMNPPVRRAPSRGALAGAR
jgi:dihydroorotase